MTKSILKIIACIAGLAVIADILIMLAHRLGMEFAIPWFILVMILASIFLRRKP